MDTKGPNRGSQHDPTKMVAKEEQIGTNLTIVERVSILQRLKSGSSTWLGNKPPTKISFMEIILFLLIHILYRTAKKLAL